MEEKNDLKTWWSALGKWQVLITILVLAVFFITRHITGDNNIAAAVVAFTAAAAAFAAAFAATAATAIATVAALVVFATVITFATFAAAIILAVFAAVIALVFATAENQRINKKMVYLSCAAEFVVILLPILGTVRGWW